MRRISAAAILALALPAFAAGATKDVKLALVAYSTPKDAYAKIIPAFQKTSGGKGVTFSQSYGASGEQAIAYLTELFKKHVVAQPSSAREALQAFLAGKGDVVLSYENEAILAKNKGQSVSWVAPKATILIENPVAATSTTKHATEAKAF